MISGCAAAAVVPVAAPNNLVLGESLLNDLGGVQYLVACHLAVDAAH
jgi:hypothetical protein